MATSTHAWLAGPALAVGMLAVAGCEGRLATGEPEETTEKAGPAPEVAAKEAVPCTTPPAEKVAAADPVPCATPPAGKPAGTDAADAPAKDPDDIPRYADNSPFNSEFNVPVVKEGKRLWAASFIWSKAPELVVETWLTDKPDTEGKYVLIEFWNTWCPPCRRSLAVLNGFHRKYGKELVVIGVCDEKPETVRNFKTHKIEFFSAIDTQARTKKEFGVFGVPHAVILEPEGYVIWEGFPLLKGYELTDKIIERILAVGRKLNAKARADAE
jgi:cytochrome c biogenesis protein CcmG/thiol:disulfide interchange protein DsbE